MIRIPLFGGPSCKRRRSTAAYLTARERLHGPISTTGRNCVNNPRIRLPSTKYVSPFLTTPASKTILRSHHGRPQKCFCTTPKGNNCTSTNLAGHPCMTTALATRTTWPEYLGRANGEDSPQSMAYPPGIPSRTAPIAISMNIRQPTQTAVVFRFHDGRAGSNKGGQLRRCATSQNTPSAANSKDAPAPPRGASLCQLILANDSQAPQIAT